MTCKHFKPQGRNDKRQSEKSKRQKKPEIFGAELLREWTRNRPWPRSTDNFRGLDWHMNLWAPTENDPTAGQTLPSGPAETVWRGLAASMNLELVTWTTFEKRKKNLNISKQKNGGSNRNR